MRLRPSDNFWRVWRIPFALAALTCFGLLAALLGTGVWHGVAWLALAVPVAISVWCAVRRPEQVPD